MHLTKGTARPGRSRGCFEQGWWRALNWQKAHLPLYVGQGDKRLSNASTIVGCKMTEVTCLPDKALVYATNRRGLLIFREPDFPEVPAQVPGGTIHDGEDPMVAAKREFAEETGIPTPIELSFLRLEAQMFDRDARPLRVTRHFYHAAVSDDLPETWDHHEKFASDGADPILFRFFWISLVEAPKILGVGMGAAIPSLKAHLADTM